MFISIFIKALFALMIILFYAFVRSSPNNHEDEEYLDELDLFQKKFTTDKGRVYYRYRAEIKNKLNASFKTTSYELYQKWGLFSTIKIDLDEFDALILIISDDPELKERLQDNSYRLAHIILILFKKYPDIEIDIKDQMLYVDFNDHTFQFEDLTLISEMKNMIKQKEQSFDMTANDAQKQKLLFIVEMIFVLMISQGLAGFIGVFGIYDYYFSISSLLPYSFILYLSLVLFSILLIKLFLKSSSLIYDVLSTLTALILFFYPLVAITTIADINIYFDKSIAKSTEAKVLKKGQAYKNSRYINISLPERKDEVFKQSIPRSEWEKLSEGDQVIVWQKDGYLNIPYFSKLDTKK